METQKHLLDETLITFAEAAEIAGASYWGVRGWAMNGCEGIRLESIRMGHRRLTSREALRRFSDALTELADGEAPSRSGTPQVARGGESPAPAARPRPRKRIRLSAAQAAESEADEMGL